MTHAAARRVIAVDSKFYIESEQAIDLQRVLRTYAAPTLLKSYKGYNLVGLGRQILAAPICLGRMDLTSSGVADDARIIKAPTTDDACRVIDAIDAAGEMTRQIEAAATAAAAGP